MLYRSKKCPNEIHITLANIIDDLDIVPGHDSYFEKHVPWLPFDENIPKKDDLKLDN